MTCTGDDPDDPSPQTICQSNEIAAISKQQSIPDGQNKHPPKFFLFVKPFHSYIFHNSKKKGQWQFLFHTNFKVQMN